MNHLSIFLNQKFYYTAPSLSRPAYLATKLGDFCLTPVRYLFDGKVINISCAKDGQPLYMSYWSGKLITDSRRSYLRTIAAIVFLIPGVIIGSAFKGAAYLLPSIRQVHRLALLQYQPIDRTIGSEGAGVGLEELQRQMKNLVAHNRYSQPTKNLVIYAAPGTEINEAYQISSLNPKKIILVGARITHELSVYSLDDRLQAMGFEGNHTRLIHGGKYATYVAPKQVASVDEAIQDVLPKNSRRVYVV